MSTSSPVAEAAACQVRVTNEALVVELEDGRVVSVPLGWYPRLAEGTAAERRRWELIGPGIGIHWPDLDEDISVEALLLGQGSNESSASLRRWRTTRQRPAPKKKTQTIARNGDMRPEYDFRSMKGGVRGKYVERVRESTNIVVIEPEVAEAFPTERAVNEALKGVLRGTGGLPNPYQPSHGQVNRSSLSGRST
jgi:Protein of unknown function (DUF2442)